MAFMASPELFPGAGSPQKLMAAKPLKRARLVGPVVHRPEAKEEKGTIFPAVFRT